MATSSQLPAHFLAYKQKAEEEANKSARVGNAGCWSSTSFFSTAGPRTSASSTTGMGSSNFRNSNENDIGMSMTYPSSERSFGSSPVNGSSSSSSGVASSFAETNGKIGAMWNRFSGKVKATVTGMDGLEVPETHSAELDSKSGFPTNKHMTNVDRLKSMAASSVRKPEIPDVPLEQPPSTYHHNSPQQQYSSSSSYPSLASSHSDGSSSLESTASSGRFWSMGNKIFGTKSKTTTTTGIGSHQDPSIGELNKTTTTKSTSFFPTSMTSMMMTTITKVEEKKDIDIEKLKRLRDQAAGLAPPSPAASMEAEEHKEEEKVTETLESQIDDLEKEMGMIGTTTTTTPAAAATPSLRMDGFDDVHEEPKKYAEIKVSTLTAVSHLDAPFKTAKKMPSPLATFSSSANPNPKAASGGLSTVL